MIVCSNCGIRCEDEDEFCGQCGQPIDFFGHAPTLTQKELKACDIHYNLGVVYFKMGKYEQALESIEKLLRENPSHQQALEMRRRIRTRMEAAE